MILYIDENMPKHLAEGFNILQIPENIKNGTEFKVEYLPDVYGYGAKDVDWIPELGKDSSCIITQDINITRRKDELEIYRKSKIGLFLLKGSSKKKGLSVMEMIQALSKNWEEICKYSLEEKKPFTYEFSIKGKMKKLK